MRKVRTASGAVAVQVVTRRGRQVERIEHVGSAHTDAELQDSWHSEGCREVWTSLTCALTGIACGSVGWKQ